MSDRDLANVLVVVLREVEVDYGVFVASRRGIEDETLVYLRDNDRAN